MSRAARHTYAALVACLLIAVVVGGLMVGGGVQPLLGGDSISAPHVAQLDGRSLPSGTHANGAPSRIVGVVVAAAVLATALAGALAHARMSHGCADTLARSSSPLRI